VVKGFFKYVITINGLPKRYNNFLLLFPLPPKEKPPHKSFFTGFKIYPILNFRFKRRNFMAKEATIECCGIVTECLPNEQFKVRLDDTSHFINAYIAGNMRKHQIRVLVGDRVTVEMTPYDMTKGRIRFRGIKTHHTPAAT
jgi:translation initiation factor IF-1